MKSTGRKYESGSGKTLTKSKSVAVPKSGSSSKSGYSKSTGKSLGGDRKSVDKSKGRTTSSSGKSAFTSSSSSGKNFSVLKRQDAVKTASQTYSYDSGNAKKAYSKHKSEIQAKSADGRRWGKNDAKAPINYKKKFKKSDYYGGVSHKNYYGDHIYKQKIKIDIDYHYGGHHYDHDDYWPHSWYGWYHHNSHWPWYGYYYYDHSWHAWPSDFVYHYDDGYYAHYYHYAGYRHIYPRHYYRRCRSESFYFFVDLGDYHERYVPSYVIDYQTRLERHPIDIFDADDHVSRSYAQFATRDYYRSVLSFYYAIQDYPDDGLLYLARAQAYAGIKDYRAAYEDIMYGMRLIPDWPEVRFNLAEIYSDPEEASYHLMKLEEWLEERPRDWRAHFVLGYFRFFLQDYEAAKLELIYTLAHEPDHWQAERMLDEIRERELEIDLERDRY